MRRALLSIVLLAGMLSALLAADRPEPAGDGGEAKLDIPANTWVQARLKFERPADIPDATWATGDGYSAATYRSADHSVLWRSGISSKKVGLDPGFYGNATLAWKPAEDVVRVVTLSRHWGGGSGGHGKLLDGFAENVEPTPRHTYDGITYVPEQDALYLHFAANWRIGSTGANEEAKKQLLLDNKSTWRFSFKDNRWTRIDENVNTLYPGKRISPYESHLQYWPEGNKLLFFNDHGDYYSLLDPKTDTWAKGELKSKCPMSLYNARSTWDSKRSLWVFRLGPNLCTFDPKTATFAALPAPYPKTDDKDDPRRATKGIAYVSKHDVYLIAGPTGKDTFAYSPADGKWTQIDGGEAKMVNGYMEYDPASDLTVMVYQHNAYRFRYVPPAGAKPAAGE